MILFVFLLSSQQGLEKFKMFKLRYSHGLTCFLLKPERMEWFDACKASLAGDFSLNLDNDVFI